MEWSEEQAVFVPEMDEEHEALFRVSEELRQALLMGEPRERLDMLVGRLSTKLAAHFQHEERLMRFSRYAAYDWHERQHQTARLKLAAMRDSLRGVGRESVFETLEAMTAWMVDHIAVADHMLAAHLRNYQREQMAS